MSVFAHEPSHRELHLHFRLFVSKQFRIVTGCGLLLIIVLGAYLVKQGLDTRREIEKSKRAIPVTEVQIEDFVLSGRDGNAYRATGRVRNKSPRHTLTALQLRVFIRDCYNSICDTVGQADVPVSGMEVPPAQLRWLDRQVYFSSLPPLRGSLQWSYSVDYVTAK